MENNNTQDNSSLSMLKRGICEELDKRVKDKILEKENADLLKKLINKAESIQEAQSIAALGTTWKRTGFHFDKRLEKQSSEIAYLVRNETLSFCAKSGGGGQNASNAESSVDLQLKHKLIIGDNYPALQNLLISYREKIKVIYIDPPYGKDDMGNFADTNYNNAITRDNLLSMLYPRLQLARELLREDGVIFCSIDDRNQAYVKCLFDEVFGEGNFVANIVCETAPAGTQSSKYIAQQHSYCLVFAKQLTENTLFKIANNQKELIDKYNQKDEFGLYYVERLWKRGVGGRKEDVLSLHFPVFYDDKQNKIYIDEEAKGLKNLIKIIPYQSVGVLGRWTWGKEKMIKERHKLIVKKVNNEWKLHKKQYIDDDKGKLPYTIIKSDIARTEIGSLELKEVMGDKVFDYPKSVKLLKHLLKISTTPNTESQRDISASPQYDKRESKYDNAESQNDKGRKILDEKSGLCSLEQGSRIDAFTDEAKGELRDLSLKDKPVAEGDIVLDFFAGSGTTAHAVLEINREDGGNRTFILVTNNEITDINPNGIAYDVTTKRLKRIMGGECYDGSKDFKWLEKNAPYGGILEVSEIKEVNAYESKEGKNAFTLIDERLYGKEKFSNINDKIAWVCENFSYATKKLEVLKEGERLSEKEYIEKLKKESTR